MSDIKKKPAKQEIRNKDKLVTLRRHIKNNAIHMKKNTISKDNEEQTVHREKDYAIHNVSSAGKKATTHITNKSKFMIKHQMAKHKENKKIQKQLQKEATNISSTTNPKPSVRSSIFTKSTHIRNTVKNNPKKTSLKIRQTAKIFPLQTKQRKIKKETFYKNTYHQSMHKYLKHSKHIKNTKKNTYQAKQGIQVSLKIVKKSFIVVCRAICTLSNIIGAGISLILLIVIVLFIGIFAILSDTSVSTSTYLPLSEEVLAYTDTIEKYAELYDMNDYVSIIQAVMMQESKGLGNDPMQSSECHYNTKYPNTPNAIEDPEYSIDVGVHYLSDCFNQAEVEDVYDTVHIYLALQGYNYGTDYISWAITNFGGYSKANANVYADQKKTELGVDVYGDSDYVSHVMQYVGLGFGNYREQPNFDNKDAWGSNNPYSQAKLYGQCTWFAWGRFYEIYGYSPGFTGDGWDCVDQLIATHPDKFKKSDTPAVGAVFSCIGRNHTGIVIGWDGTNITIQEGNLDGKTNTFEEAKKDWQTVTYTLSQFQSICKGVVFAVPIN